MICDMKKVIYNAFGDESVLQIIDQPIPTPEKDQVLVRVKLFPSTH
jgi:NADPH:quinone reductase-like Zn-dependent oxidoreductase